MRNLLLLSAVKRKRAKHLQTELEIRDNDKTADEQFAQSDALRRGVGNIPKQRAKTDSTAGRSFRLTFKDDTCTKKWRIDNPRRVLFGKPARDFTVSRKQAGKTEAERRSRIPTNLFSKTFVDCYIMRRGHGCPN